jgi:DNA primase
VLPGSSDPAKYKNSAETPIYSKRRTLYALNWAKPDVVATGEVVVCEGYTDVIGFFGAGVQRAVATCGTALAEEHVKILRNFATRIVLAFDADTAGQAAAGRFYEWERRLEIDVAVAALPPGADPADLARTDPAALAAAVRDARPFLSFRVEGILAGAELGTAEGRAKAADAALGAVAEHPDDLVRDQYVMLVAERCRLEPERLRERLEQIRRAGPRDGGPEGSGPRGRRDSGEWPPDPDRREAAQTTPRGRAARAPEFRPGLEALRLAIHRPEEIGASLDDVLFADDVQREAFRALVGSDDLHEAIDGSAPPVAALLTRLAVEEPRATPEDVLVQLVRDATRRELVVATAEARESPEAIEEAASATAWLQELDDPALSAEATARLVAWLVVRSRTGVPGRGQ